VSTCSPLGKVTLVERTAGHERLDRGARISLVVIGGARMLAGWDEHSAIAKRRSVEAVRDGTRRQSIARDHDAAGPKIAGPT
jgi:hypothetical protein